MSGGDGIDRNLITIIIGIVFIVGAVTMCILAYQGKQVPDGLLSLTMGTGGALFGALLPRSAGADQPVSSRDETQAKGK